LLRNSPNAPSVLWRNTWEENCSLITAVETNQSSGPAPEAVVELRPLEWDTAFFGARMGTLLVIAPEGSDANVRAESVEYGLRSALEDATVQGYAHLIFRAPSEDLPVTWGAERAGLRLVDVGIDSTFRFSPGPVPEIRAVEAIRPALAEDLSILQDLAGSAFVHSRFAVDPFFSNDQVVAFHRQWITNLCRGLAQEVLVYELEGRAIGFVSCALDHGEGRIPLIATEEAVRGRGIGRDLVAAALRWFAAAGASVAHVKTQATNYPALALYHRSGFNVSHAELTFSVALGQRARN
jgi:ribosomal protein S18 acetylase RimI-like enzyme